jgi:hypothetical protein
MKQIRHSFFIIPFFILIISIVACNSNTQQDTSEVATNKAPEDKSKRPSPPAKAEGKLGDINILIDYSQPSVKGRTIFGGEVSYGKVWRTGANEATIISFDKDVLVEGKPLPAGNYSLFSIPNSEEWIVIFNKIPNQWGAFEYKEEEDALRVTVKPQKEAELTERLIFEISEDGIVSLKWENMKVAFKVTKA